MLDKTNTISTKNHLYLDIGTKPYETIFYFKPSNSLILTYNKKNLQGKVKVSLYMQNTEQKLKFQPLLTRMEPPSFGKIGYRYELGLVRDKISDKISNPLKNNHSD